MVFCGGVTVGFGFVCFVFCFGFGRCWLFDLVELVMTRFDFVGLLVGFGGLGLGLGLGLVFVGCFVFLFGLSIWVGWVWV